MDSMRLWDKKTKKSLDKDVYRFDKGDVISTYRAVADRILAPLPGVSTDAVYCHGSRSR